jgi:hypothetical protein
MVLAELERGTAAGRTAALANFTCTTVPMPTAL